MELSAPIFDNYVESIELKFKRLTIVSIISERGLRSIVAFPGVVQTSLCKQFFNLVLDEFCFF